MGPAGDTNVCVCDMCVVHAARWIDCAALCSCMNTTIQAMTVTMALEARCHGLVLDVLLDRESWLASMSAQSDM